MASQRRRHQQSVLKWLILLAMSNYVGSQDTDLCRPEFGYEKFMQIEEDTKPGTVILILNTTGNSSQITLTMQDSPKFAFNATSQELSVLGQLDADRTPGSSSSYSVLKISCTEPDSPEVEISVTITIKDVNDNVPQFTQDHFYVKVPETMTVGQQFESNVLATDADASYVNNEISYTVQESEYSDYVQFPNQVNSYMILLKPVDYETLPNFTVTVVATNDRSPKKLNSTALLTIQVTDEDDLNPVFSSPLYEGIVLETAQMNALVNVTPTIYATDADVTLNEPILYSFHDAQTSQQMFTIDNETAEVRLVGTVGPSKVSVVVQATQKDNPSRYGVAMLVITVVGVNSNAPQFQKEEYHAFVSEAVPAGTALLFVSATDKDFGATIRYGMAKDNPLFEVEEESGAVLLKSQLDFETSQFHSFVIKASDGNMESTATVEVNVMDANDNAPVIPDQPLAFDIQRDNTSVITQIQASDADAGTKLSFRLLNHMSLFSIDDSGNFRVSADPGQLTESEYQVVIIVSDNGTTPYERAVLATLRFPPLTTTTPTPIPTPPQPSQTTAMTESPMTSTPIMTTSTTTTTTELVAMSGLSSDTLAIVLGAVAAVLLVVVVVLVVLLCRRRGQTSEQLDKAKVNRSPDPKGLKFKNAARGAGANRVSHLHFAGEDALDGTGPAVQENPLSYKEAGGAFNPAFVYSGVDGENDHHMDEIHIETAVIPYQASDVFNNNNSTANHHYHLPTEMYQQDDSSEYGYTLPMRPNPNPHHSGSGSSSKEQSPAHMLPPDNSASSAESLSPSHTYANSSADGGEAAKQLLMGNGVTSFGTTSFGKKAHMGGGNDDEDDDDDDGGDGVGLDSALPESLNPDVSVAPQEQKSELTVYF